MIRAAVYCRYSSERQRATSIEDQLVLCRDAAPRFHCGILEDHIYTDSEVSGATDHRPAYQALLKAAKTGEFDAILVESQDRLWRSQEEMHHALARLRFWRIKVYSVATGTDLTDKAGNLIARVTAWKDSIYLQDLADKTRRGLAGQIRRGYSGGGRPYGYRSEPVLDESGKVVGHRRAVDSAEAVVVRRIFTMYCDGKSPRQIARALNSQHVVPPRPVRGRKPLGWTPATISGSPKRALGILCNPMYDGRLVWNRHEKVRDPDTGRSLMRLRPSEEWLATDVPDLRIVPPELWEAAQKRRLGQRMLAHGNLRGRKAKYLLSGLLTCAECGSHYVIQTGGWYGCASHANRGETICSNAALVRRDRAEETILRLVFEEVFDSATLAYLTKKVGEALSRRAMPPIENRKQIEADLTEARRELDNIAAAIKKGIVTDTTKTLLLEAERRVSDLEARLQTPGRPKVVLLPHVVEKYLKDLKGTLGRDPDRARQLLATLLGPIVLHREGDHMMAEVRGNLRGLLELEEAPFGKSGSGGWI